MRDRKLTGPWAGFAFKGGRLVTPEGRELEPQDLAWLSLTAALAQEWRLMMQAQRERRPVPAKPATVVVLRDVLQKRSAGAMAGPDADPARAAPHEPGPRRCKRV